MTTAIVISGHMRSFDACLPRLAARVFSKFEGAHFYVSTIADEDTRKAEQLIEIYGANNVTVSVEPSQPDCIADLRAKGCELPGAWERGRPYMRERYPISVHPQSVARQLWQLERAWAMIPEGKHDKFVRVRPDLWFHSLKWEAPINFVREHEAVTPWWGRFDGVNDRFAIMGAVAARAYFTTYSQIPEILREGGSLHPETLVSRSLERNKCASTSSLHALFSTRRTNGEIRPPEIIAADIQHLTTL